MLAEQMPIKFQQHIYFVQKWNKNVLYINYENNNKDYTNIFKKLFYNIIVPEKIIINNINKEIQQILYHKVLQYEKRRTAKITYFIIKNYYQNINKLITNDLLLKKYINELNIKK